MQIWHNAKRARLLFLPPLPYIWNTTVVGTQSWSSSPSSPRVGWRQLFSGIGEEEESNQECWNENDSWEQLEIVPNQNNYSALFVMDLLHENASNETGISAEAEESRFQLTRTAEADLQCGNLSLQAITCVFIWWCSERERFWKVCKPAVMISSSVMFDHKQFSLMLLILTNAALCTAYEGFSCHLLWFVGHLVSQRKWTTAVFMCN